MAAGMILLCSILAVLFVANAIKVNELMERITAIEGERDDARRANEGLRSELTNLMSVERIVKRAREIGLVEPQKPPVPIPPVE
jgi:cell division protein FtsL